MKTFKGKPITLLGETKKIGDHAPDFKALNTKNEVKHLSDFKTPYVILNVVPSLDTTVCDRQAKTVNQELSEREDIMVLTISNDLPTAQDRWCGNSGLSNVITLSDHLDLDFANKYGTNIKEIRLQARSVFVLDKKRKIIYLEYVDEMSQHLNFDELLTFVRKLPKE
ncbi:thiol peroxidase [Peloplasma aerotolerans]|uniref:Thiol peroxidase n=1 Tax=Peloplasma aerotolerans TaxID=3044389 RepID=A0AAW6UFJ7_9MOLU|nr:thiol peroxidase [Mariniplasma sp. M4Ah]MDI6453778.1 thiol peroxidase [Mariniplasma sp. M4Ah]MDR4968349.1 thiol peroxidase [Acholeplasmataceae bacterium]